MDLGTALNILTGSPASIGLFYDGFDDNGNEIDFEDWKKLHNLPPETEMWQVQ